MPQGDAKVLGSPQEISLSLTCLLSPGFWGTPSIPHSARQLCRLSGENKCPRCFVSVTNETQVREQGTQGHGLTSKSFLFPICRHPCKTSCAWEGARESQRVRTAREGRFASSSQQGRQRSEGWKRVRGDRIAPRGWEKFAAALSPAAFLWGWTSVLAGTPWLEDMGAFCSATARLRAQPWQGEPQRDGLCSRAFLGGVSVIPSQHRKAACAGLPAPCSPGRSWQKSVDWAQGEFDRRVK